MQGFFQLFAQGGAKWDCMDGGGGGVGEGGGEGGGRGRERGEEGGGREERGRGGGIGEGGRGGRGGRWEGEREEGEREGGGRREGIWGGGGQVCIMHAANEVGLGDASPGNLILDLLLDVIWWNPGLFSHKHNLHLFGVLNYDFYKDLKQSSQHIQKGGKPKPREGQLPYPPERNPALWMMIELSSGNDFCHF